MSRAAARAPAALAVPAAVAAVFLVLPLLGLVVRAPWRTLPTELTRPAALEALRLSLVTASLATVVAVLLGVPLAWVLARSAVPGRGVLRALVTVPLVLPPVVGGVALLLVLGRNGLVGRHLEEWVGVSLPFSPAGVVVAQTFVAMPFLVISVEGALRAADSRFEDVAASLGARPMQVFGRVTLPLVAPGLAAGAALAWARALGEFGATVTFAGSLQGRTQTLPIAVYERLGAGDLDAAVAMSVVLLGVCLVVLAVLRNRWLPRP